MAREIFIFKSNSLKIYENIIMGRVFKFSWRPAQVTGYFKHLHRVLFVFQILITKHNSVSLSNRDLIFSRK